MGPARAGRLGRLLLAAAVVGGVIASLGPVASARGAGGGAGLNLYVGTDGNDSGNPCTSKVVPCATINRALSVEGASLSGGTIHVARGTYAEQVTIGHLNTGVTIVGASAKKTIIEAPSSGLASTTDPNSPGNPLYYVVQVTGGVTNVSLQKLTVNGASGIGAIGSAPCSSKKDYAGIYFDDASGTLDGVDVTGVDMPSDQFGCAGAGRGVYVASDASGTSSVTMTGLSLLTPTCSSTTTVPLPPGTYSDQNLPVKAIKRKGACKHWTGGPILVGGVSLTGAAFGSRTIQVTGTVPYYVPAGATVNIANSFLPAYDGRGILCENPSTWCSISSSTVQGEGPTNLTSQSGIEVDGASATIAGNTVTSNANSCGALVGCAAGDVPASGIHVLDGGTTSVTSNTATGNDVNVLGAWDTSGILPDSAGRTFSDGTTTAGVSTLTSSTANFLPSDVGRAVTECSPCAFNSFTDGAATNASPTFSSATANFTTADVGTPIVDGGDGVIPAGTTINAVTSPTTITMSKNATCVLDCSSVPFNLPARHGLSDGTVISGYVSSNVVLLSAPATVSATRSITLGPLPGTWDIAKNTATDATAVGGSAGVNGFGEGIELDSTDPDACTSTPPDNNAAVIVQGNKANDNAGTGILLASASCAVVGGSAAGQGNTATGNQIGLALNDTGTWQPTSSDNAVSGNTLNGNAFGVVASGFTTLQQYGGPPATGPGSTGNLMSANTWTGNSLADVLDFAQWGHSPCSSSCSLTLSSNLTAGTSYTSIDVTSVPTALTPGTVIQISEGVNPVMNILVTAPVPVSAGTTTIPTTTFTALGTGYDGTATVAVEPFSVTGGGNTWGASMTPDSCDPTTNGSAPFDSLTFSAGFVTC